MPTGKSRTRFSSSNYSQKWPNADEILKEFKTQKEAWFSTCNDDSNWKILHFTVMLLLHYELLGRVHVCVCACVCACLCVSLCMYVFAFSESVCSENVFSQSVFLKAYFPKTYFPKAYFLKAYFPKAYSPKAYFPRAYLPRVYCCAFVRSKNNMNTKFINCRYFWNPGSAFSKPTA